MGRRRKSLLDELASMPWQVGIAAGFAAVLAGSNLASGALAPLAWIVAFACWMAALVSFIDSLKRRRLLDAQTGLDSFAAMGWRDFERLVGEAYRREGYSVEETGLGGPDGGIDLILRGKDRTTLVQVKQWRRQNVDVPTVREIYGLMVHHRADAVRIATLGGFTAAARRFAEGKPIELMDAKELLALVSRVESTDAAHAGINSCTVERIATESANHPDCPNCGEPMVRRKNRRTADSFWGCKDFPRCKGTRSS